jgi:hypothetical protein
MNFFKSQPADPYYGRLTLRARHGPPPPILWARSAPVCLDCFTLHRILVSISRNAFSPARYCKCSQRPHDDQQGCARVASSAVGMALPIFDLFRSFNCPIPSIFIINPKGKINIFVYISFPWIPETDRELERYRRVGARGGAGGGGAVPPPWRPCQKERRP